MHMGEESNSAGRRGEDGDQAALSGLTRKEEHAKDRANSLLVYTTKEFTQY